MKKRLRKKKHRGEFTEWGRQLVVTRNTRANAEAFQDAFIFEAIEGNGCFCGGSLSDERIDVVVELGQSTDRPEAKFERITAWLDARSDVAEWQAGELFDLWHGKFSAIGHPTEPSAEEAASSSEAEPNELPDETSA